MSSCPVPGMPAGKSRRGHILAMRGAVVALVGALEASACTSNYSGGRCNPCALASGKQVCGQGWTVLLE